MLLSGNLIISRQTGEQLILQKDVKIGERFECLDKEGRPHLLAAEDIIYARSVENAR